MSTIRELLQVAYAQLTRLETAALDSEVLLSYVLNKPREYILSHGEDEVPDNQAEQFQNLIAERARHKPVAYLIKRKEFYGRDFYVDERVHIPGPATEDLIDYIKKTIPADFDGTFADIGTGSGCIAITLALEFPQANIMATDISSDALEVARDNALRHGVAVPSITFYHGNLLEPLAKPADIIVSNPPYGWLARRSFSEVWSDDPAVEHQPKISYDGGADGLDIIKRLIQESPAYLTPAGQAFIKFDPRRKNDITALLDQTPFSWEIKKDLAGWDRIFRLTKVEKSA